MLNTINNRTLQFLDLDPLVIAQQMTLYEQELYKVIILIFFLFSLF
jgi:hypothetical protein